MRSQSPGSFSLLFFLLGFFLLLFHKHICRIGNSVALIKSFFCFSFFLAPTLLDLFFPVIFSLGYGGKMFLRIIQLGSLPNKCLADCFGSLFRLWKRNLKQGCNSGKEGQLVWQQVRHHRGAGLAG